MIITTLQIKKRRWKWDERKGKDEKSDQERGRVEEEKGRKRREK
jgi:hypothetical protein